MQLRPIIFNVVRPCVSSTILTKTNSLNTDVRSSPIIHIRIKSVRSMNYSNNLPSSSADKPNNIKVQRRRRSSLQIHRAYKTNATKETDQMSSEIFSESVYIKTLGEKSSEKGTTHETCKVPKKTRKKRYWKKSVLGIVICFLVVCAIIGTLLGILLNQNKKKRFAYPEAILRWNTSGITIAGITGMPGNDSTRLQEPWDITVDWMNTLYIADRKNNRVQKYFKNSTNVTTIVGQADSTYGTDLNHLNKPCGVYVNTNGDLYVSDRDNNRVLLLTSNTQTPTLFAGNGTLGTTSDLLAGPYGFDQDVSGNSFYISDRSNDRIMRYRTGSMSGELVAGGNNTGSSPARLSFPCGIYFDSFSNYLYIANSLPHNIIRWTPGTSTGSVLFGDNVNGSRGNTSTLLWDPVDITLDPMGNIYVVDRGNHRIQFFPIGQSDGLTIAGISNMKGNTSDTLSSPSSVALDSQLNLYVAESGNHRVQLFRRY